MSLVDGLGAVLFEVRGVGRAVCRLGVGRVTRGAGRLGAGLVARGVGLVTRGVERGAGRDVDGRELERDEEPFRWALNGRLTSSPSSTKRMEGRIVMVPRGEVARSYSNKDTVPLCCSNPWFGRVCGDLVLSGVLLSRDPGEVVSRPLHRVSLLQVISVS